MSPLIHQWTLIGGDLVMNLRPRRIEYYFAISAPTASYLLTFSSTSPYHTQYRVGKINAEGPTSKTHLCTTSTVNFNNDEAHGKRNSIWRGTLERGKKPIGGAALSSDRY
jgi:hypothetical protein